MPQAPGAEDNASGIGVLLAIAEAMAGHRTRLPVVLVAFGSEEPRGPTDDDHHYGSTAYVASLDPAERRTLRGMVSLDRVGVGAVVPVGAASSPTPCPTSCAAAARRAGVPTLVDTDQRSSDHWSFVREGLPGARLGSTSYAAYHSPDDVPSVVEPRPARAGGPDGGGLAALSQPAYGPVLGRTTRRRGRRRPRRVAGANAAASSR